MINPRIAIIPPPNCKEAATRSTGWPGKRVAIKLLSTSLE